MILKIMAISDLHGNLPIIEKNAEIAIIAGDIIPLNIQFHKPKSKKWFETAFANWIKILPVEKVFMIAGNHDAYLENISKINLDALLKICEGKLIYLENELVDYFDLNGLKWTIFGTPYCSIFGNWPFMRKDDILIEKFQVIPDKVDIIISHDPPFALGDADVILDFTPYTSYRGFEHLGNKPLTNRLKTVDYKILFCGHIHSGDHNLNPITNVVNVSYLNENYKKYYKPLYIELIYE